MGASSWRSYTTYREDPETALQELRQRMFEAGEYSMGGGGFFPANGDSGVPDPAAALEKHGLHDFAAAMRRMMNAAKTGDFSGLTDQERQSAQEMKKSMDMLASLNAARGPESKPKTIRELLKRVAEDGTHSVLDIVCTAKRKQFGAAIPLPPGEAKRFFGTDRPDHDQVESNWATIAEKLERWEAYYVAVWKDGEPYEYAFIGCSGD